MDNNGIINFSDTSLGILDLYKDHGTSIGDGITIGDQTTVMEQGQNNGGLSIGNFFPFTFCPTAANDVFNLKKNGFNVQANDTKYLPLSDITPPDGLKQFLVKGQYGNSTAIKLDFPRPITVISDVPFLINGSGYDRRGQKVNNFVESELIEAGNFYKATFIRAYDWLTSISFQNKSETTASTYIEIIFPKIIEIPYLMGASPSFNFMWGTAGDYSLAYSENLSDNLTLKGGTLTGGNEEQFSFDKSLYIPILPTFKDPEPMTEFTNGPRFLWNLDVVNDNENNFPFDQKTVYTIIQACENPYITSYANEYENILAMTQEEWLLGLNNYSDEFWTAWKG